MNKTNRRIQRPQALETLASEVRLKLAPAEKAFFDLHWHYGPQPSAEIFPDKTKGAVPAIAHKLRAKLDEFFEGPAGIQNRHRLGLTPATHDRIREIEIQENVLPAATAFWLAHLCDGRRTRFVVSEQFPMRQLNTGERLGRDWKLRLGPATSLPIEATSELPPRPVRLADVQAMMDLYSYFKLWQLKGLGYLPPEVVGSHSVEAPSDDNLILIGTSRDWDGLYERKWAAFPLALNDRNLIEWFDNPGGPDVLGPEAPNLGGRQLDCCGVLVSRIRIQADRRCVTIINGSHSVAVRAVCELLTDNKRLGEEVVTPLAIQNTDHGFPDAFQVFFGVAMSEDEERARAVKALQFRTLEKREPEPEYDQGVDSKLRSAVNSFVRSTARLETHGLL